MLKYLLHELLLLMYDRLHTGHVVGCAVVVRMAVSNVSCVVVCHPVVNDFAYKYVVSLTRYNYILAILLIPGL